MSKNFVFTSFENDEPTFDEKVLVHIAYKRERCPNTSKDHWQGCCQFKNKTRRQLGSIARLLGSKTIHVEKMRGTYEQALNYVRKKETAIGEPIERGDYTTQGERTDWKKVVEAKNIRDVEIGYLIRYSKGITFARNLFCERRDWLTEVVIIFGKPGTGKSRYMPRGRDTYWKPPDGNWWDDYAGEEKVVLDEWSEKFLTRSQMLRLCDRYPLKVPIKGGFVEFVAKTIYITTNENPWTWYGADDAWLRRINFIWCSDFNDTSLA